MKRSVFMGNDQPSRREQAKEVILGIFLAGKHKESGFREAVFSEHQDLMPEIEQEFLKLEQIKTAIHGGAENAEFSQVRDSENTNMPQGSSTENSPTSHLGFSSVNPHASVPNYQLLRCVGRGGFGEVWLSRNVVTEDYHAVKVLAEHCSLEIEGVRRYTEQVKLLVGLVPIKEVGKTDSGYYYVMPLADDVKGGAAIRAIDRYEPKTLAWCYKNQPPLTCEEIAQLGTHLLGILEDLHETGLTHCDVKPANVIAIDGEWMLSDIGLMTRTDHFPTERGTLEFLPPERRCDHSADLYALAKTLFLLATGASIYRFEEFVQGDLKLPVESQQSEKLRQILGKACDPDAEARYIAARDMCNDFRAISGLGGGSHANLVSAQLPDGENQGGLTRRPILFVAVAIIVFGVLGLFFKNFKAPKDISGDADIPVLLTANQEPTLIMRAWQDIVAAQNMDGEMFFSVSVKPEGVNEVTCLSHSKDSPELAVGGIEGVVILDSNSGDKIGQLKTGHAVTALCWRDSDKQLFIAQDSGIEVWDCDYEFQSEVNQRIARVSLPGTATSLGWSSEVALLAAGTEDGRVLLIRNQESGDSTLELFEIGSGLGEVKAIAWCPGRSLVAIGLEEEIRLWWISSTTAKSYTIENELILKTSSGRNLVWLRNGLLNVTGDAVENWQFTVSGDLFESPNLSNKKRFPQPN